MGALHHLSIDLETYSSVNIGKSGLYRYAQSPDFEILLLAYSLDGAPVQVIDLTQPGAVIPSGVMQYLLDPGTVKHAYNAAFEWYCLSRRFRASDAWMQDWLSQWRCTMLHGLYCGYPSGLEAVGRALGLAEDQRKLATGKALIKYFCQPCKPTKVNGGRTRNLPRHDPEKWELFKQYNAQDVVTEMEVERRLSRFPVPDEVQRQWVTDQVINLRGVAVDEELVEGALALYDQAKAAHLEEAEAITGLSNPNSVSQLKDWLSRETGQEIGSLRKADMEELLGSSGTEGDVRRMLELRQELSKTSVKKYQAIQGAVCADGRVRGLLQFYGANRTGRWSGRLVQPQNLPRTYIRAELLPLGRELVKGRQGEGLRLVFGSVTDTLSQLIRTAFIAKPGGTLIDADFSAIEARVVAWLAGEEWVLEVFRTHGKIYEATASQLYGVPMEKIKKGNPEYSLRQYGKAATLALGYGGGASALVTAGHLPKETPEEELLDIRDRWRGANPAIVQFWNLVAAAAREAMHSGRRIVLRGGSLELARECDPENGLDFLTVRLPNGRKLYYAQPHPLTDRWGRPSIGYWGMNQSSKKWQELETYGGKLTENITQAIARDCLAEAIERLEAAGYQVVFHIHDEVVIDAQPGQTLEEVERLMSVVPEWAPGLPLGADGWTNPFFKKD